ncbi:MAG: type II toxin-antitoxin system VapC family toxin [Acidobacteria bacterium]|nr:type II toxin-antitoxin system VapC family toxin [Acidobacteriota bacterium]
MRFWDSSALLPLCLAEPASSAMLALLREDPGLVAWWGSPVECRSALARLRREGRLTAPEVGVAGEVLSRLRAAWVEVLPVELVRDHASRVLDMHPLRAADALQLASALVWAGTPPRGASFVTLDARLWEAARLEGFEVLPPACP